MIKSIYFKLEIILEVCYHNFINLLVNNIKTNLVEYRQFTLFFWSGQNGYFFTNFSSL